MKKKNCLVSKVFCHSIKGLPLIYTLKMTTIEQRKIVINWSFISTDQVTRCLHYRRYRSTQITYWERTVNLLTYARARFYIFVISTNVTHALCWFLICSKSLISENEKTHLMGLIERRQFGVSGNLYNEFYQFDIPWDVKKWLCSCHIKKSE